MRFVVAVVALTGTLTAAQRPTPQDALLARLAIDLAAERDATPISVDSDGSGRHGVVYDRFTIAQTTARAAKLKGTPLDPLKPPASLVTRTVIVVAVPLTCGDRTMRPTDVDIDNRGRPVLKWQPARGATIQTLLPGVAVPAGAIAVQFADPFLLEGEIVKISYAGPACPGVPLTVDLPVVATGARALERPTVEIEQGQKAPPGPVTLNIQGAIDLDGRLRYATAPEASTPFGALALAAANKMRFEPARINRAPTPWTSGLILDFGVSESAPPAVEGSTADAPSVTAATSRCPISDEATYGVTGLNPVRIGGGVDGLAREQQYMKALRGPAGQGLRYERSGPVMNEVGRGPRILDAFELQYAGLAKPMRIYFDTTREEPLMAPAGLTCAAPLK